MQSEGNRQYLLEAPESGEGFVRPTEALVTAHHALVEALNDWIGVDALQVPVQRLPFATRILEPATEPGQCMYELPAQALAISVEDFSSLRRNRNHS